MFFSFENVADREAFPRNIQMRLNTEHLKVYLLYLANGFRSDFIFKGNISFYQEILFSHSFWISILW